MKVGLKKHRLLATIVVALAVTAAMSGCERSSYPGQDINSPLPDGAVIEGVVEDGGDTTYTDGEGDEVDIARTIGVMVDGQKVLAISEGFGKLSPGQAVELTEGYNGRWFVTDLLEKLSSPAEDTHRPSVLRLREGYTAEIDPADVRPGLEIEVPAWLVRTDSGGKVVRFEERWMFLNGGGVDDLILVAAPEPTELDTSTAQPTAHLIVTDVRLENTIPDPLTGRHRQRMTVDVRPN